MRTRTIATGLVAALLALTGAPGPSATALPRAAEPDYSKARSTPVRDPYFPDHGDPRVDALHYDLVLKWFPQQRRLAGRTGLTFRATSATRTFRLDLDHRLVTSRVSLDGTPVSVTRDGDHLLVDAGRLLPKDSRHELRVVYAGRPGPTATGLLRSDLARLGWTVTRRGEVWTMQEPWGASTYHPVNDHPSDKAYYDAAITTPARMKGIFGGELVSRRVEGRRRTMRWRMTDPVAPYLVTVAIGDYVRLTDKGPRGMTMTSWLPRRPSPALVRATERMPAMLRWLRKRLGPYPFDQAGLVAVPGGSAMETQTLVTINRDVLADRWSGRATLLHELAHQWYGDAVTPQDWTDLWLNEAWAMYVQIQWEARGTPSGMKQWRRALADLDGELRDQDGPPGAYDKPDFGSACVYYCGALMLDQLRAKMGGAAFRELSQGWPRRHRHGNADREDFIAYASQVAGTDLSAFVNRWLTSERTPPLVQR
jgi:aminopeptidase N